MSFSASAHRAGGTFRNEVSVNGRHTIVTDEPQSLGGTDTGPAPHELLPAMVASCISTTVMLYASRRGWPVADLQVDVDYDAETTPRRLAVTIHLPDGLTSGQVDRLQRVANSCPVRRAFDAGFTFDERLVLDGGAGVT